MPGLSVGCARAREAMRHPLPQCAVRARRCPHTPDSGWFVRLRSAPPRRARNLHGAHRLNEALRGWAEEGGRCKRQEDRGVHLHVRLRDSLLPNYWYDRLLLMPLVCLDHLLGHQGGLSATPPPTPFALPRHRCVAFGTERAEWRDGDATRQAARGWLVRSSCAGHALNRHHGPSAHEGIACLGSRSRHSVC